MHAWANEDGVPPRSDVLHGLVLAGQRPDLGALRRDTPAGLVSLLQQCWAQAAEDRPRASDAFQVLGEILAQVGECAVLVEISLAEDVTPEQHSVVTCVVSGPINTG